LIGQQPVGQPVAKQDISRASEIFGVIERLLAPGGLQFDPLQVQCPGHAVLKSAAQYDGH
jgi:hypothetical protein